MLPCFRTLPCAAASPAACILRPVMRASNVLSSLHAALLTLPGCRSHNSPACREPLTYKEFMFKLPDDITPEEAQKEYQRYLAEYWGSEIRAEFQAKRNESW